MGVSDDELLRAFAAPCRQLGVELDDVEQRSGVLQVTVERAGGLDLDTLAEVSRVISELLDAQDELAPPGHYELEVSSPGLERRLRRPQQYRRVVGGQVSVRTRPGSEGDRRAEGTLQAADEAGIVLVLADGSERRIAYQEIDRARTVFDWQAELSARRASERAERRRAQAGRTSGPGDQGDGDSERDAQRERAARS